MIHGARKPLKDQKAKKNKIDCFGRITRSDTLHKFFLPEEKRDHKNNLLHRTTYRTTN